MILETSEKLKEIPRISVCGGKVTEINQPFLNLIEYSKEEFTETSALELFRNLFRDETVVQELSKLQSRKCCFMFTKALEPREVFVSVKIGCNADERVFLFNEKPNSRLDKKMSATYKISSANIWGVAVYAIPEFRLLKANSRYLSFLPIPGKQAGDIIGTCIKDFAANWESSPSYDIWMSVVNNGKSVSMSEAMYKTVNGEEAYWDFILAPVEENSKVKFVVVLINDVTEKVISAKMKEEFLTMVSHEFKTPLAVINSAIQSMELVCANELSEKARWFLSIIKQNTYRQLKLVNNLLDITRLNAGHTKVHRRNLDIVLLARSITESVSVYGSQRGVKLCFSSSLPCRIIGMDDEKFERILLNLLSNAIKFTPKGRRVLIRLTRSDGYIKVDVKDNGIGIPEDKLKLIFERFGQVDSSMARHAEGTGIGLSLVKLLVNALGGEITVKSQLGKGSTFTVAFPDIRVSENSTGEKPENILDNRVVKASSVEFSDIYLSENA